eukprot:CAMPEP_0182456554 /NCGR_PEP_ID=MMETSP1319-20130603/2363_1 /TAXON_ID=172717 /ORGANISM="Bolidomonas pacifica, Strain RCC208" /LENGTH=183 /DNA_ID=CAMNT_0024654827 /DNA_START=106 /DNA_END=658 /DNA_ORIENTATION=-
MLARKGLGLEMRERAVFMLVPYLIPTVHRVFQPADRTELKAGVELYMRDPKEAKRLTPRPSWYRRGVPPCEGLVEGPVGAAEVSAATPIGPAKHPAGVVDQGDVPLANISPRKASFASHPLPLLHRPTRRHPVRRVACRPSPGYDMDRHRLEDDRVRTSVNVRGDGGDGLEVEEDGRGGGRDL